jgi:hypothetical protein
MQGLGSPLVGIRVVRYIQQTELCETFHITVVVLVSIHAPEEYWAEEDILTKCICGFQRDRTSRKRYRMQAPLQDSIERLQQAMHFRPLRGLVMPTSFHNFPTAAFMRKGGIKLSVRFFFPICDSHSGL